MTRVATALTLLAFCTLLAAAPVDQRPFQSPDAHGDLWSLCGDPSTHLLKAYEGGVSIFPARPKVGEDIEVVVSGNLASPVQSGHVNIDLKLLSMIKVNKELDLCEALASDIMGGRACPLAEGDVELRAQAHIPSEVPKLPVNGQIKITNQDGNTVTCIQINLKLA
ncbi:hypothetical protein BC938DRAFT_476815 [Jimgerdemannia flammicorona]|uniref:Phosphatidylglycerol/phosphatidylinositol transfer protein n=1 Tax=Jimgerdemannia flammicorona TaxID=994334 RepID=A0A433PE81_9FUNG|nr:hypothetical protein BC938DRAFT_476815 [Jimgerdemannia flammicorona]